MSVLKESTIQRFIGLFTDDRPVASVGSTFFCYDSKTLEKTYDGTNYVPLELPSGIFLSGTCNSDMTQSTTTIVCADLAGYGDDYFNLKFYLQVILNKNSVGNAPEFQVRQITDYVSTTGTFTTGAFSANVQANDEVMILHESIVVMGRDDADNIFASSNVVSNADGSILERQEYIQTQLASNNRIFTKMIAQAANLGSYTLATVGTQKCRIKSIVLRSVAASQTDMSSCAITGGDSNVITFLSAADTIVNNLDAIDDQVSWSGDVVLPVGGIIKATLAGTGATVTNLEASIEYLPLVDGGLLS